MAVFSLEEKMKFIDRKISESYYQLYIIFDVKEKKEYLDMVKKDLLNYFGSVEEISQMSIKDLQKVGGISKKTAEKIYNYFHV